MSTPPVDMDVVRLVARQIIKIKGIDNRRKAIKTESEKHGGLRRVAFEQYLKAEIDRIWIGRKG